LTVRGGISLRHKNLVAVIPHLSRWCGAKFFVPGAAAVIACCLLSGCDPVSKQPPNIIQSLPQSAILSSQTETLTPDELRQVSDTSPDKAYILGPDDEISVYIYLHPELDVPTPNNNNGGALITSDGTVELPLIGSVHLGGLTLAQANVALTNAYATYVTNPKISIQLQTAQSLRYYLLGEFASPGIKYPVHPLTLLEALALGGSVNLPNADLYEAYVAQGNVKLPVDLYALLVNGDLAQNIPLASGDAIVIPSSASEFAYIFGAVGKPGPEQFVSGSLSLLQGLAAAGLDLTNYTNAELSRIHIIRAGATSAQFMIVDASMIMKGQAASFALEPGDIVFVPPTLVASWNQVLSQILPSLQVISGVLSPFVQIRYLARGTSN
jgi:polysaccharide export outer membrane protein